MAKKAKAKNKSDAKADRKREKKAIVKAAKALDSKAERQKQYIVDAVYRVKGASGKVRNLTFKGRLQIGDDRFLVFKARQSKKAQSEGA